MEVDGCRFDSKKEAARYLDLKAMAAAGLLWGLKLQEPFVIEVNGYPVCKYVADFAYDTPNGFVVEDVKSRHTRTLPVYRLKRKLMQAVHGIAVQEV